MAYEVLRELMEVNPEFNRGKGGALRPPWIIDLDPDGGDKGGEIVVMGTPEDVAEHPTSHTARYLKQVLEQHPPESGA